ncbi:MAG: flavodoxin domain-containing protein [Anaerolineae bacterium]|nr:flavodoxin domain-containing protein [Anaerolineae bacterium]
MTKALVLYHSQEFGNTHAMAQAVAEGLRSVGCEVDLFNTNDGRYDIAQFPGYDCAAFGSPDYYSYVAGNLKQFMDDHYIADVRQGMQGLKGKPYALFYSHGGGGRVIDAMKGIFRRVGAMVGAPVGSRGHPTPQILEQCRALGRMLADAARKQ